MDEAGHRHPRRRGEEAIDPSAVATEGVTGPRSAFVGADQGDVTVSAYLVNAPPGRGPRLHRHDHDEIMFIQQGRGRFTVGGIDVEAGSGEVLVVKAGEPHKFVSLGPEPLVQLNVDTAPHFTQEWLE